MRAIPSLTFLAFCLAPALSLAQAGNRADVLTGRVTDLNGRPVADAQVGATALGSGLTRSMSTGADGRYRLFFPGTARQYLVLVKRLGFAPAQRTITRQTDDPEEMTIDMQLGGAPLALSMVEIEGGSGTTQAKSSGQMLAMDISVPNPIAEILAMKDTLHLSAVQIVGLSEVADTLNARNTRIYKSIRVLLAKSQQAGDPSLLAGTIALMLEGAASNTAGAVGAAEKLLRPGQWLVLPQVIRDQSQNSGTSAAKQ